MGTLHFKLGEGLGLTLLEIAQEAILNGNPDKGIKTYTDYLYGCEEKYALALLKGEAVLETDKNGTEMNFTTDSAKVEANKKHIYDWQRIIEKEFLNIQETLKALLSNDNKFYDTTKGLIIDDYDLYEMMGRFFDKDQMQEIGVHNIAAKLIGGGGFNNQSSNGEMLWDRLCWNVEQGEDAMRYEYLLYYTVEHYKLIRALHKEYLNFGATYKFLLKHKMVTEIPFVENTIESILQELIRYTNTGRGHYHPMCNVELAHDKVIVKKEIEQTEYYKEMIEYGVLKKNILDGYDAGWLSPDGEFFGAIGETREMIHLRIAEQLYNIDTKYGAQMHKDGVMIWGSSESPERWLEKHGWVKIHHQDCHGSFIGDKDWTEYPYCPTAIQVKMICAYADKHYNGKFYTEADAFGRIRHTEPYSTYKVRQMDEIMLHKIFGH